MTMYLTRRRMITTTALLATAAFGKTPKAAPYRYVMATLSGPQRTLPADRYVPFDWAVGEVSAAGVPAAGAPGQGEAVQLRWQQPQDLSGNSARLRITSATDVRESCRVTVKTTVSGHVIGTFDMRYAMYLQPFELPIPAGDVAAVLAEGVTLTMQEGTKPFWFFAPGNGSLSAPTAYLPHLLLYDHRQATEWGETAGSPDRWRQRFVSLDSVQTFGWMEGCVLDGLHELSRTEASARSLQAKRTLAQHLDLFFADNTLVYANLNNQKAVGWINTVESILPFAILAQTNPGHPLLQTAIQFCQDHASADGVIADGTGPDRTLKTEECYTVSYPLAVLAQLLNRPDLAHLAIQTALARVRLLAKDKSIYQRGTEAGTSGGTALFENWSRGVAWYLLGLVKTLTYLPHNAQAEPLHTALKTAVDTVLSYQQPSGLWYCFMHQPETGPETSGTAGIAAALAYGAQKNHLPKTVLGAVRKARTGLIPYLTPDGYLTGTAQGNKGGDALQRGGFRVISPYTLGFLAHIDTYLT